MDLGMTYAEDHIYYLQEKSVNILNLQKFLVHTGEETLIMKCFKEFMEQAGLIKKT